MPKTLTATEVKTRFGAVLDWAASANEDVVIESHGRPKAVILSYEAYQQVLALREQARRRELLGRLRALRDSVRAQNQDLTPEQAEALADGVTREAIDRLIEKGEITYEGA